MNIKKLSIYLGFFIIFFFIYIFFSYQIKTYSQIKEDNLHDFVSSSEFTNFNKYFLNALKTPYKEYKYIIQNNDSIGAILRSYKIPNDEITFIVKELRKKKLTSIYAGREISIVYTLSQTH